MVTCQILRVKEVILHWMWNGKINIKSYFSSVSRAMTLACIVSWSSCCSSKSLRTFRRTPSKRSTSPSLSSTCRFNAFTRRDSWGRRGRGKGVRGGQRRSQVKTVARGAEGKKQDGQRVWQVCGFVGKLLQRHEKGWGSRKMRGEGRSGSVLVTKWGWVWVRRHTD